MNIHWTENAVEQLLAIYEYLVRHSPRYAQRTVDKLTRRTEQLAAFPRSGRLVPEYERDDIREIIESPYRIIYRVQARQIDILTIVHSSQVLPPKL